MLATHEEIYMKFEIITSFNKSYYDMIGKDCVESWLAHWPKELELTCYVEQFTLPNTPRIKQISFDKLGREYDAFQNSHENDRVKIFAKKAYSVIHALQHSKADRVIWIDADVITKTDIKTTFLESLCPEDTLSAFMGVKHHKIKGDPASDLVFSAETGFFIINKVHPDFDAFLSRYSEYYNNHITDGLRRFYDGDVFGAVIHEMSQTKVNDLTAIIKKSPKTPLKYIELGNYIHHFKSKSTKDRYIS